MSLAPLAYLLYQNVMTPRPVATRRGWAGTVSSCRAGHSSLTQYIQLYLSGYGLSLDDLKALRTWGSQTPGHPEVHHTKGVEITTGPLGSGLASAVGMAMAQRRQRGLFDPDAKPGTSPFDHHVYVIASDGDMQEGVSHEACSLAGHQELGNLTVVYDANQISIEDDTDIAFSEDVAKRVRGLRLARRRGRLARGRRRRDLRRGRRRPARCDPVGREGHRQADPRRAAHDHRVARADEAEHRQVARLGPRRRGGRRPRRSCSASTRRSRSSSSPPCSSRPVRSSSAARRPTASGTRAFKAWRKANPDRAALLDRVLAGPAPEGLAKALPTFPADEKGIATRAASGKVLTASPTSCPSCGAARPTSPSPTTRRWRASPPSSRASKQTSAWKGGPYGRTLHFGIRENGMGMILNGIALEGLTRPYGGTFLVFSDYMRPAVRLAAIQQAPRHLRVDARLDRPRRGRTDPPARSSTSPRCAPSRASTSSVPRTPTRPPRRGPRSSPTRPGRPPSA